MIDQADRGRFLFLGSIAVSLVLVLSYLAAGGSDYAPAKTQDPCKPRNVPSAGGITGFLQGQALKLLDSTACRLHASREELVLALADEQDRKRFQEKYGVDVRSLSSVLGSLISG